jgi:DNA-binding NarL/FixJ family response regulator
MKDLIDVVETIYMLSGDERTWLGRIAKSFSAHLPDTRGVLAYTYDASPGDRVAIRDTVLHEIDPALFAARADVAVSGPDDGFVVPILRTAFVETLRRSPQALRRSGMTDARVQEYEQRLHASLRHWKLVDQFWVNAQDPTFLGCCFIMPSAVRSRWLPREQAAWRRIAAHVSSAFRIRRRLAASGDARAPEAILHPDGVVAHATQPAQAAGTQAALRRAVLAFDKARGPMRSRDPEKAMHLWQGLVEGRWSLLDHFDTDGRRFVVAHRNDATVPDARGLTWRERQVAAQAALGQSNKVIAYALGLSVSTVGEHLASARKKLRGLDEALARAGSIDR